MDCGEDGVGIVGSGDSDGDGDGDGVVDGISTYHMPFVKFRCPVIIILSFLMI